MIWRISNSIYCGVCDRYKYECIGKNEQVIAERCNQCRTQINFVQSGSIGQEVDYGTLPRDYELDVKKS